MSNTCHDCEGEEDVWMMCLGVGEQPEPELVTVATTCGPHVLLGITVLSSLTLGYFNTNHPQKKIG